MGMENFDQSEPRDKSAEAPQSNERDTGTYEYYLGISPSELSGKRVLNIGSGKTGLFEKSLAQNNVDVFTTSPHLLIRDWVAKV